jgi:Family of unknown function (DUF6940)
MWSTRYEELDADRGARFTIDLDSRPATFVEVLRAWIEDEEFRAMFSDLLANSRFSAFRWEAPPVTALTVRQHFEFVLLDSPALARGADSRAFAQYFGTSGDRGVVVFPNIGRDAVMVVPSPIAAVSCYAHLAAFVRDAPEWQRHALWRAVGEAMVARVGSTPVWLSTAGAGVSWLHVRLDDRPKYYGYAPYRRAA